MRTVRSGTSSRRTGIGIGVLVVLAGVAAVMVLLRPVGEGEACGTVPCADNLACMAGRCVAIRPLARDFDAWYQRALPTLREGRPVDGWEPESKRVLVDGRSRELAERQLELVLLRRVREIHDPATRIRVTVGLVRSPLVGDAKTMLVERTTDFVAERVLHSTPEAAMALLELFRDHDADFEGEAAQAWCVAWADRAELRDSIDAAWPDACDVARERILFEHRASR